jgi:uncharacterized MAPEG superfamily protein
MSNTRSNRLPTTDSSNLLAGVLAVLFVAALLAFALVMLWMDHPDGLRSLVRLGSTVGLVVLVTGIVGLLHLFPRR